MHENGYRLAEQLIKLQGQEPDQQLEQDVINANPALVLIHLIQQSELKEPCLLLLKAVCSILSGVSACWFCTTDPAKEYQPTFLVHISPQSKS